MASQIQIRRVIPVSLIALCAAALFALSAKPVLAHQLTNVSGTVIPHQHVLKRSNYGDGFVVGHVAPTRHGHNMIIWSPAPSSAFGNTVPRMHIIKPNRHSRLHQQRNARTDKSLNQQLRQRNRRDDR